MKIVSMDTPVGDIIPYITKGITFAIESPEDGKFYKVNAGGQKPSVGRPAQKNGIAKSKARISLEQIKHLLVQSRHIGIMNEKNIFEKPEQARPEAYQNLLDNIEGLVDNILKR